LVPAPASPTCASSVSLPPLKSRKADLVATMASGKLEGDVEKGLRDALTEFAKQFSVEEKK
jgi:hypothetical protein